MNERKSPTHGIAPAVVADAELLRLRAEFERLWSAEDVLSLRFLSDRSDAASDAIDAAVNTTRAVVEKFEVMRATTLLGMIVKVRAFSWCHSNDVVTAEELFGPKPSTELRLMMGIMRDLALIEVPAATVTGTEVRP
ncbi:hypothetical protein [Heyndrickxia sporothermodurans]